MNEINNSSNQSTAYDDVFRPLLNDCSELIIPVVNEIFHKNYETSAEVILFNNELFINQQNGNQVERITDSNFAIGNMRYHLECQSTAEGSILIRVFEYDSQIALKNSVLEGNILTVWFPTTAVMYLRHTSNTPDFMTIIIRVPDDSCSYNVPTMKVQTYTVEEIFQKKLFFLIPFHIFTHEKNFELYNSDEEYLSELKHIYANILERLEESVRQGHISEYVKSTIVDMSKKVLKKIAQTYSNVQKEVGEIMGGKILEYEAKDILNTGKLQSKTESLLELLERFGTVPEEIKSRIQNEKSLEVLKNWFTAAINTDSIENFLENTGIYK